MSFAVCLDQNTPNFNVNTLSPNGFSIYTNLDLQNPIYQGIPYTQLFQPPIGNCPFLVTVPQGATQLIIIDQCDPNLDVAAAIFSPTNLSAGQLTVECCYAVINIPQEPPPPFCETCTLTFDTFLTATTGSITAGNLSSTCGPVTDYTIGWYLNGNYSAPVITSGFGNTFTYQFQHPLTGNGAIPVLAGNWEGIIHDIKINGVTYSSVSGSGGGQLIPFNSCFDTVVAEPLNCENGAFQGIAKYSHQINFNSQAVGATSAPVSLTYTLNPTTKYFAYLFKAYSVWDEIEIKWKSGDPNATSNPSFYSQPIYLEKIRIGGGLPQSSTASLATFLPNGAPDFTQSAVWPKESSQYWQDFRRVLTLTTLPTSSNPSFPDLLEITISPNPSNNNTQWQAAFQCLDDFDCADCTFDNWPNNLPKISQIHLQKDYTCPKQRIEFTVSGCYDDSDFLSNVIPDDPLNTLSGNLISSFDSVTNGTLYVPLQPNSYISLLDDQVCSWQGANTVPDCGPSSTGTITLNNTPGQIQLIFDLYSDFLHYYNDLNYITGQYPGLPTCPGTTDTTYYKYYVLKVPIQQSPTANCGDNSTFPLIGFSYIDYLNTTYVNAGNPNASTWEIIIPRNPLFNCYPPNPCYSCPPIVNGFVNNANTAILVNPILSFTTTVGAKCQNPFGVWHMNPMYISSGASGSVCKDTWLKDNYLKWYNVSTIPFVPSPSSPTGWVNLTNLMTTIPCNFDPYGDYTSLPWDGLLAKAYKLYYKVRFPSLTGSFNYSLSTNDFEVYTQTNISDTGSYDVSNIYPAPCPDPSSSLIFSYIGGVPTVYSSSYFVGGSPTLIIDP